MDFGSKFFPLTRTACPAYNKNIKLEVGIVGSIVGKETSMLIAGRKKCPACAKVIPTDTIRCIHCGKNLGADPYEMIFDGFKFGIALNGQAIMHGMEFKEAKETVSILNSAKLIEAG